ncbi:MAG: hypothetical protein WKG07_19410, partial [Hymenobacter sp.]
KSEIGFLANGDFLQITKISPARGGVRLPLRPGPGAARGLPRRAGTGSEAAARHAAHRNAPPCPRDQ